ncbi:MAG: sugar porter family MFS transporter [Pseudomonadota bacterium]|nr:sugar porter family MFS transporter [Pseudomonadota bacterium]
MNQQITYWSITVAIAGFLFGFDTAVISGADQPVQTLWQTGDLFHGLFIMSAALWGTVIGALFGNWPCDRYGRKRVLVGIGVLYLVSAIGSALAPDPYSFSVWRFIGGLGVGASSIAVPAYISEMAPPAVRGRLVALYQLQIVFGILVAFASNYALSALLDLDWRWMLGVESLPALAYVVMVSTVPESPRWLLLKQGNEKASRRILEQVDADSTERTLSEIRATDLKTPEDRLFRRTYWRPVMLAFLIAAFNQLSGINFIIYFAPRIFSLAGLDSSSALLSTAGIGIVNLTCTLLGMWLIDRAGRKSLMLIGSIGYIVSLSAVTWAFGTGASGMVVVLFVFLFIASHAVGQGAVIWVFIAEIFPNKVRTKGQSLGCGTHWLFAALITLLMPLFLSRFEPQTIFSFFTVMMILQLLFVIAVMPETRGQSLESLAARFLAEADRGTT